MNDPVKHCALYKERGCSHVDGYLCDYPDCSMLKEHERQNILAGAEQHADKGYSIGTEERYNEFVKKRNNP